MTNHYDGSRMMRLCLCGRRLDSELNALGLYHDKSVTATYPVIPHELGRDLVRGLWDGDGHVGQRMFDLSALPRF